MARNDPQVAVRLPPEVKAFIKAEALENASSQNSEIVRAIRERMKRKGAESAATDPRHATENPLERKNDELSCS
ncbi:MAG: Arc family DNA-binding protein [Nitratireductor sp.]|nr:Arc family DNA-binding protein [Nitratireductor sp.]